MLLHAEVDVRHGRELAEMLDGLPLEPWHEQLIGLSALETVALLTEAWFGVVAPQGSSPAAMPAPASASA